MGGFLTLFWIHKFASICEIISELKKVAQFGIAY
jgi:hypothetical protein